MCPGIIVNRNRTSGNIVAVYKKALVRRYDMFDFKPSWTNCGIKLIDTFLINNLILFIRLL